MESVAYILILALAIGVLFFAIAFREPPRIQKKEEEQIALTRDLRASEPVIRCYQWWQRRISNFVNTFSC